MKASLLPEPTYKAIIIDDEPFNRSQVRFKVEKLFPEIKIAAECSNGQDGLIAIATHHPDLVFLDVMMPEMDGFEMLERIPNPDFEVIFITVSDQFAIKAIRLSALDYLLKPLNVDELSSAIIRFKERKKEDTAPRLKNLLYNVHTKEEKEFRLAIHSTDGIHFIPLKEIVRCQANGSYTQFYLMNDKIEVASKPLSDFEEILAEKQFIRVHKSHMVNKTFIRSVNNRGQLVLENNQTVEIARRKIGEVKKNLNRPE